MDKNEKTLVILCYAMMIFGFGLISFIIALIKKGSGSRAADSHYLNMVAMALWFLLWAAVGGLLTFIGVGFLILAALAVLALVRIVIGLVDAFEGDPYRRDPKAPFI